VIPFPLILSAPSGAGKTTIARRVLEMRTDVGLSVSATTRERRPHEVNGRDYYFLDEHEFGRRREAGEFAESAVVHGRRYGTLRSEMDKVLASGRHVLMAIDVQGARTCHVAFPNSVRVFVLPPSVEVMVARLRTRNTESEDSLQRRLRTALGEVDAVSEYDYVVINDKLDVAASQVCAIIDAEMARYTRAHGVDDRVAAFITELRRETSDHV
jgi:guanylate kinase